MTCPQASDSSDMERRTMVIFTDLDGTLLDSSTYSFESAHEALDEVRARSIPLVLVSSKTRAEIALLRDQLNHCHPFIVENGGAAIIPQDYFPFSLSSAVPSGCSMAVEWGTPYPRLRAVLQEIQKELGIELRGYGEMTVDEIAAKTGLSRRDAKLAQQREYDEPFVVEGDGCSTAMLAKAITARGLRWTQGDRFHHLMGEQDKGQAVRYLVDCYRRLADHRQDRLMTVGIGNSLNDLPMLEAVDCPILVQRTDGSYEPGIELPRLTRAPGPGPIGWNRAVLSLLAQLSLNGPIKPSVH